MVAPNWNTPCPDIPLRRGTSFNPDRDKAATEGEGVAINLQAWQPASAYARRLRQAPAAQVYGLYLDERDSHAGSTAFYLDVADILFGHRQPELALRVLSNLAELDLENRHILRVLGYRLMQAGEPALAALVFERAVRLAEEEPQSFRDLGLAYAAQGLEQSALDACAKSSTALGTAASTAST